MDSINKNKETQLKINNDISHRHYYHTHKEYGKNKNRKYCGHFALRYRTDPEFQKKNIDTATQFNREKKLKGSGNIMSFLKVK